MDARCSIQFTFEFIDMYKKLPCLWDNKSKLFYDTEARKNAYDVLANKLSEVIEDANRQTVTKEINALRSCHQKEVNEVSASLISGATGYKIYNTRLIYFDYLLFLYPELKEALKVARMTKPGEASILTEENLLTNIRKFQRTLAFNQNTDLEDESNHMQLKNETAEDEQVTDDKCVVSNDIIYDINERLLPTDSTELDHATRQWAPALRFMSRDQQIQVQKIVSEILFEGQLGNLSPSTKLLCSNPPNLKAIIDRYSEIEKR